MWRERWSSTRDEDRTEPCLTVKQRKSGGQVCSTVLFAKNKSNIDRVFVFLKTRLKIQNGPIYSDSFYFAMVRVHVL